MRFEMIDDGKWPYRINTDQCSNSRLLWLVLYFLYTLFRTMEYNKDGRTDYLNYDVTNRKL